MAPKTDGSLVAWGEVSVPADAESFRQAMEAILTIAVENEVDVENTSWKCVSEPTPKVWDVEITPVDQP